jgi:hypothetical protein
MSCGEHRDRVARFASGGRASLTAEMSELAETWAVLRGLRANPPGHAANDPERREVFAAALEQAEQFLIAASAVGYATKPVQLFYALSQAGRAIAAANADEPWKIAAHGAEVKLKTEIGKTTIEQTTRAAGGFGVVARATSSAIWQGAVPLGALWASLPELPYDDAVCHGQPPALQLLPEGATTPPLMVNYSVQLLSYPMPVWSTSGWSTAAGVLLSEPAPEDRDLLRAEVAKLLEPYPNAASWTLADDDTSSRFVYSTLNTATNTVTATAFAGDSRIVWLRWRGANGNFVAVEVLTEEYQGRMHFRPGIGPTAALPSPLMTWWAILQALSMHARYDPVGWREALDIDSSPIGWMLERGLVAAQVRIPELVLAALS